MRKAYIISAVGHAAILLWSVLSFAAKPLPAAMEAGHRQAAACLRSPGLAPTSGP